MQTIVERAYEGADYFHAYVVGNKNMKAVGNTPEEALGCLQRVRAELQANIDFYNKASNA